MAVEEAWRLLRELTRLDMRGRAQPLLDSPAKRRRLRDAVLVRAFSFPPLCDDTGRGEIEAWSSGWLIVVRAISCSIILPWLQQHTAPL